MDGGLAHHEAVTIGNEQYLLKLNNITFSYVQMLDIYSLPRAYLVLFAAGFNNSVNLNYLLNQNILPIATAICQML